MSSRFVSDTRPTGPIPCFPGVTLTPGEFFPRPLPERREGSRFAFAPHIVNNIETICSRFTGSGDVTQGDSYLLTDGPGTGKSSVLIEVCEQMRHLTSKPSIVVVKDEQSVAQAKSDLKDTGLKTPEDQILFVTYEDLPILLKNRPEAFGCIACDEAHVLSQPENREALDVLKDFKGSHLYVTATAFSNLENVLLFQELLRKVPQDQIVRELDLQKDPSGHFDVAHPYLFIHQLEQTTKELVAQGALSKCELPLWGKIDSVQVTGEQLVGPQDAIMQSAKQRSRDGETPVGTTRTELNALAEYSRASQVAHDVCEKILAGEAVILYGNDLVTPCPALKAPPFNGAIPSFAETVKQLVRKATDENPDLRKKLGEISQMHSPDPPGNVNDAQIEQFHNRRSSFIIVPPEFNEGINSLNDQDKANHRPVNVFVAGFNHDLPLGSSLVQMYGRAFRMNTGSPSLGRLYTTEGSIGDELMTRQLRQSLNLLRIGGSGVSEALEETVPKMHPLDRALARKVEPAAQEATEAARRGI